MLVTVETDNVISYQYVNVEEQTSMDLKLSGEHVPNVYITATLIKPHEIDGYSINGGAWFSKYKVEERRKKNR